MRMLILAAALLPWPAWAQDTVVLPVKLLDTSNEARDQQADHARRQDLMGDTLARALSAERVAPGDVAAACPRETTECLVTLLRDRDADRGLFVVVQKTSTLILQVFADLVDVNDEKLVRHAELSFRGDNDESWQRAADFLAGQLTKPD